MCVCICVCACLCVNIHIHAWQLTTCICSYVQCSIAIYLVSRVGIHGRDTVANVKCRT